MIIPSGSKTPLSAQIGTSVATTHGLLFHRSLATPKLGCYIADIIFVNYVRSTSEKHLSKKLAKNIEGS